jgi:hypothetical protein
MYVKFSALVDSMRGAYQGTQFRVRAGGGSTAQPNPPKKNHIKLTKGDSGRYVQTKNNVILASTTWRNLSINDKTAWDQAAAVYPHINKFGVAVTLTGFQYYMLINLQNLAYFATQMNVPAAKQPVITPEEVTAVYTASTEDFSISVGANQGDSWVLVVYAAAMRTTNGAPRYRNFKLLNVINYVSVLTENVFVKYEDLFGTVAVGSTIDLKLFWLNQVSMEQTTPYNKSVLIEA